MNNLKSQFKILLATLAVSNLALGQNHDPRHAPDHHYGDGGYSDQGPGFDLDHGDHHSDMSRVCDKYSDRDVTTRDFRRACTEGVIAAASFAPRVASAKGNIDGYLRGYAFGLHQAATQAQNDQATFNLGTQDTAVFSPQLQVGLNSIAARSSSQAQSEGSQEARNRFSNAVGTGHLPAELTPPPPAGAFDLLSVTQNSYQGETNGFEQNVGQVPSLDSIALSAKYANTPVGIFDRVDHGDFGRDEGGWAMEGRNRLTEADMWRFGGQYNFDLDSATDGNRGYEYFRRTPEGRFAEQKFSHVDIIVLVPAPPPPAPVVTPAPTTPPAQPAQPTPPVVQVPPQAPPTQPIHQPAPAPAPAPVAGPGKPQPPHNPNDPKNPNDPHGRGPTQAGPTMIQQVQHNTDITGYFKEGFTAAYADAARFAYSQAFRGSLDQGYNAGVALGQQIGLDEAYYQGQESAVNAQFKTDSYNAYQKAFAKGYRYGFASTYSDYANHPKLSVSIVNVADANDSRIGIIRPNAEVYVQFRVRNEGGVATSINVSAQGDLQAENNNQSFTIDALSDIGNYVTKPVGRINSSVQSHQRANVDLLISQGGQSFVATSNPQILKQIELVDAEPNPQTNMGSGWVKLVVHNNSAVRSPTVALATLILNGQKQPAQSMGFIEAHSDQSVILNYSGLDPLDMIAGKDSVSYKVELDQIDPQTNAPVLLGADNNEIPVPGDMLEAKLNYYDAIWSGTGFIPGTVKKDDRISLLRNDFFSEDKAEVLADLKSKNESFWDDASRTVVGKIAAHAVASKGNPKLRQEYNAIGYQLYQTDLQLLPWAIKWMGVRSHQRKYYENIVQQMSTDKDGYKLKK